ncbi:MAG: 50S ribosomal protein L35 [Candidatus Dadabacteria bacterium]|nr:50S ribosomal protein L35 [Candidatus Dadabacteria bacterium]
MAKVKMKSNRSAAKRFKTTGSGKIRRMSGGKSHLNVKKARKRKRRLLNPDIIEGTRALRIKSYVPYV